MKYFTISVFVSEVPYLIRVLASYRVGKLVINAHFAAFPKFCFARLLPMTYFRNWFFGDREREIECVCVCVCVVHRGSRGENIRNHI
jgi:hypothetical protein